MTNNDYNDNNDNNLSQSSHDILSKLWDTLDDETFQEVILLLSKLETNDNTDDEINDILTRLSQIVPEKKWEDIKNIISKLGNNDNETKSVPREKIQEMIKAHHRRGNIPYLQKRYDGFDLEKYQGVVMLIQEYLDKHGYDFHKKMSRNQLLESENKIKRLRETGDDLAVIRAMLDDYDLWDLVYKKGLHGFDGQTDVFHFYMKEWDTLNERLEDNDEKLAILSERKKKKIEETKRLVLFEQDDMSDDDSELVGNIVRLFIGDENTARISIDNLKSILPLTRDIWDVDDPEDYNTIYKKVLELWRFIAK